MRNFRESRTREILKELDKSDYVSVKSLVSALNVSEMTVRRDLESLEERGYLIRKHGGAIKSEATNSLFSFGRRVNENRKKKEYVCRVASGFIGDGDTVFIDCGTTLYRMCHYLAGRKNLRVVTNSLPVLSELIGLPNVSLSIVGGEVDRDRQATYGPRAERVIGQYHVDRAFVGADGVSVENGLSSYDEKEANITRLMAQNAGEVFLVCDSSKVGTDSFFHLAPVTILDYLVTDGELPRDQKTLVERAGVRVVTKSS